MNAFEWAPGAAEEAGRLVDVLREERVHQLALAKVHHILAPDGHRRTREEPPLLPSGPSPLALEMLRARV